MAGSLNSGVKIIHHLAVTSTALLGMLKLWGRFKLNTYSVLHLEFQLIFSMKRMPTTQTMKIKYTK